MKKLLARLVATGVLAALTGCDVHVSSFSGGWSDADLKAVTNVVQTATIPAGLKDLDVNNRFGAIHITGADHETFGWTWKLAIRAASDAVAQQIASESRCQAELDGDHLNLVVSLPDSKEPHSIQSDFEIRVPKSASVHAQNRFGRIEIADLTDDVEARDENGGLEISNIGGSVRARTSFNTLSVSNTGPATLKNQNGKIEATGIGGTLAATTSFASLLARDIRGPAALTNQNGEIQVAAVGGSLSAKTSFNSLVASDIGGPVRLRNQNGSIKIVQVRGDAEIETSFNLLSVEGIQGDAILKNQNGGITANGIIGSLKASTSFAAMEVTGAGSKFACHNQNGAIRLRATSVTLTNIEAKTSFNTLEVRLPASLKPAIQAHTTFAEVESDFPVLMKPRGEDPFAEVAPDTARISLQNQNGKISILHD
jgi:hypothetical protein